MTTSTSSIRPLKKHKDGVPYTRRAEIELLLSRLVCLPSEDLIARCQIESRDAPDYVPDECLLYFVRERRAETENADFAQLYKLLIQRLQRALGEPDETENGKIAQDVLDKVTMALAQDRQTYLEKLDYFEVNFADYLLKRKFDAKKALRRKTFRTVELNEDPKDDDTPSFAERVAGLFEPFDPKKMERRDYRSNLDAAIDQLPPLQQKILELKRQGFQFDSKDPQVDTIAKLTNKADKTVRNQYAAGLVALRVILEAGDPQ